MRPPPTSELTESVVAHSVERLVRPIAVLCVAPNSVYKRISGIEAYDMARDARTFPGGMPVVAHPPCRAWSAHTAHQAKPMPGEKELGLWCANQLKEWGGVLEQPAHSRLFDATGLPKPGERNSGLWTIEVWQAWWGYPMRKATWLCFAGVWPMNIHVPLVLHSNGCDRRREQLMSKHQRSATTEEFARWLVAAARTVGPNK
jgi:hypothetical protein